MLFSLSVMVLEAKISSQFSTGFYTKYKAHEERNASQLS